MGFTLWRCLQAKFLSQLEANLWLVSSFWKLFFPFDWNLSGEYRQPIAQVGGGGLNLLTEVRPVELAHCLRPRLPIHIKHAPLVHDQLWIDEPWHVIFVSSKRRVLCTSQDSCYVRKYMHNIDSWEVLRICKATTPSNQIMKHHQTFPNTTLMQHVVTMFNYLLFRICSCCMT